MEAMQGNKDREEELDLGDQLNVSIEGKPG